VRDALERIVLVGLPGAGKSTVGALVASALGWDFVDLDAEIVRVAGIGVPEIFRREQETGFRARERAATAALAGRTRFVLAPGGGWVLDPTNLDVLGGGSLTVHLRVSPEVAVLRSAAAPASRPLLDGPEPVERLKILAAARESAYLQANHTVTVDSMSSAEVASLIVALASGRGGD
jgi:shikimate kinase